MERLFITYSIHPSSARSGVHRKDRKECLYVWLNVVLTIVQSSPDLHLWRYHHGARRLESDSKSNILPFAILNYIFLALMLTMEPVS